ncbi:hypothetical protein [Streptomyces tsukubensis]|uniref:hypothetical protein n=1 Tax=Streptomyces tsukubensis TaxID=83656 RepID=UPI00344D38DD
MTIRWTNCLLRAWERLIRGTASEPDFRDPWTTGVLADFQRALAAGDAAGGVERFLDFAADPYRTLADVAPEVVGTLREAAFRTLARLGADGPAPVVPVARTWGVSFGSGRISERGLVPWIARRRMESTRSVGD